MVTRHRYLARHGFANALGELTDTGYQQARLLGQRLAHAPIGVVWHSLLPRAVASAQEQASRLPNVPVIESPELTDPVPYVPSADETPSSWTASEAGNEGLGDPQSGGGPGFAVAVEEPGTREGPWLMGQGPVPGPCVISVHATATTSPARAAAKVVSGMARRRLDRPRRGKGRVIAGVCAGIAQYYGFSPLLVRVIFVIFAITGASELAYLVLWILMPKRGR